MINIRSTQSIHWDQNKYIAQHNNIGVNVVSAISSFKHYAIKVMLSECEGTWNYGGVRVKGVTLKSQIWRL